MMKFIHTADMHLHPNRPERLEALRKVCQMVTELEADLLVIAGDLFDGRAAAGQLRIQVRSMFEELPFPVFIVAGNHDKEAYEEGVIYGDRVTTVSCKIPRTVNYEGVVFVGLPFSPGRRASELLETVGSDSGDPQVLVAHASFFSRDPWWAAIPLELRKEEPNEFSMVQEDVADHRFAYVALGHWHQPTDPPLRLGDTWVAYSGTPCPVKRAELGPRKIALVELEGTGPTKVRFVSLEGAPYYMEKTWFVAMGREKRVLDDIATFLKSSQANPAANLLLRVCGYLGGSERDFEDRLKGLCEQCKGNWHSIEIEPAASKFDTGTRPAITRFVELMEASEVPDINSILTDSELRALAHKLIADDLDGVRAKGLSYALQAFDEIGVR